MSKGRVKNTRRRTIAAVLVAIYLAGVIFGCFLIWLIPFAKNRSDLLEIAENKGNEILSAGKLDEVMIFGMEHFLYDERSLTVSHESAFLHHSDYSYIRSFTNRVLAENYIFVPVMLKLDNRDEEPRRIFGIVAGVAIESNRHNRFASILVRDLPDVSTTMTTYMVLFTFMYLVASIFVLYIFHKERDLNRMRRDLIANVSHELKTPITAIRAMAETLHDGMLKDQETKHLYSRKIMEESDKLEQLVLDILELSKLQSNHAGFKKISTHADGIIPPIVDRYMMLCGDLGIHLDTTQLNLASIPLLCTDVDYMLTLFSILMDNAVKFTGKGGSIWITHENGPKHVIFCIRDNGPGIKGEDVNRIFERFYKADTAHNTSGSGLGLAIADEIAKGLGERLWVESKFGEGTSFFFTIGYK